MYYMKPPPIPEDDERRVFLRVPPNVHDELTRLAKREDRSLNNYLNRVLQDHVVRIERPTRPDRGTPPYRQEVGP